MGLNRADKRLIREILRRHSFAVSVSLTVLGQDAEPFLGDLGSRQLAVVLEDDGCRVSCLERSHSARPKHQSERQGDQVREQAVE